MFTPLSSSWTPTLRSVLRFVVGLLFVVHGTQKLFDMPAAMPGGPVPLQSLAGAAGAIEAIASIMAVRNDSFHLHAAIEHFAAEKWILQLGGELNPPCVVR